MSSVWSVPRCKSVGWPKSSSDCDASPRLLCPADSPGVCAPPAQELKLAPFESIRVLSQALLSPVLSPAVPSLC